MRGVGDNLLVVDLIVCGDDRDQVCGADRFVEHYNLTAKPFNWTYTGKTLEA